MSYGNTVRVRAPFGVTVDRVRAALRDQGFGVLTEIDVRATLRDKLGAEMKDYLILGACNPPLAHQALQADRQIGMLLPCNVVIRAERTRPAAGEPGAETVVEALDPQVMIGVTGRVDLQPVADEAARRLQAALTTLTAHVGASPS